MGHNFFTRLGEMSTIHSKDHRRKLTRGSRALYAQKDRGRRNCGRRKFKESWTISDTSKILEEELQEASTFKEFWEISQIRQRLQQRTVSFKELVKFFQIFERFTNLFPQEKLFARTTKNLWKKPRTSSCSHKIGPANRPEVQIDYSKDEECTKTTKDFQPSDLA